MSIFKINRFKFDMCISMHACPLCCGDGESASSTSPLQPTLTQKTLVYQ